MIEDRSKADKPLYIPQTFMIDLYSNMEKKMPKRKITPPELIAPPKHGTHENKNIRSTRQKKASSLPLDQEDPFTNEIDTNEQLPWEYEDERKLTDDMNEE